MKRGHDHIVLQKQNRWVKLLRTGLHSVVGIGMVEFGQDSNGFLGQRHRNFPILN